MMTTRLTIFIRAVLAGLMIAVGATVYIASGNKYIGAVAFSVGLFTVCEYSLNLFTGKVGYSVLNKAGYIIKLVLIWLGNLAGATVYSYLLVWAKPEIKESAFSMFQTKTDINLLAALMLGACCGLMMYIAVDCYKKNTGFSRYFGVVFCVFTFIICGFEHSVADMAYFAMAGKIFSLKSFVFLLVVSAGNAIGAVILPLCSKLKD